jgi:hypothetical protein
MFPHHSHHLVPLTNLTGKGSFIWNPEHQKAFLIMRALIMQDCMLHYPDHNKPFDIYTNASNYQLSAIIVHKGILVAYYSRKLMDAQKKYATLENNYLVLSWFSRVLIPCYLAPSSGLTLNTKTVPIQPLLTTTFCAS